MKRSALVLVLGVGIGLAAHLFYFQLHQPSNSDTLDGQLSWMKSQLQLSDAQYARIRELHQASSPRLCALAAQVSQMQAEFAAFETTRRTSDRVDFIEFAQFVQNRRAVSRECAASTRQLVLAAAGQMNPRQRQQYFGIVASTTQPNPLTN